MVQKDIYAPAIGGLPGVVLDGGMRELSNKLKDTSARIDAEVFPWFMWKAPRNKAIELFRKGRLQYLVVNNHSWGAWKSIQLAEDVAKVGIKVVLINAFDPTAGRIMNVPKNVEFVQEFWASYPSVVSWARLRSPSGERGGKYRYPFNTPHTIKSFMTSHIAIGSSDKAHQIVIDKVKELL